MSKCDFINYTKLVELTDKLPQQDRLQFKAFIEDGQLLARSCLQVSVDATDTASRSMATSMVMHRALWLQSSAFPKEVQCIMEDLALEGNNLFSEKTDELLHQKILLMGPLRAAN